MNYAVLKGAGYVLVHAPDMVIHNGSTQTTERIVNPGSEYLKELPQSLRSFEKAVGYPPNQAYIGNITPEELGAIEFPWYDKEIPDAPRFGRFGEIMPEDEFIGFMQAVDTFDLVMLTDEFAATACGLLSNHPLLGGLSGKIKCGTPEAEIGALIRDAHAEGLYHNGKLVGCVKRAHDIDPNLCAHVMFENLAAKASAVLALKNLAARSGIDIESIEYVIECSEEACGDMNQRGGGNFAKAIAEMAGAKGATGADTRTFCSAPTHALIEAASLVKAGTFANVAVVAGGATAKLGMNGKDHVKKGVPIIEDVIAGFAVLVSGNDGVSPSFNTDIVGRHTVGTGSAPQAVISSLVTAPLDKAGLKITDIDKFSVEMQNPDITKPAGAGNVPEANYKMIAALSVMRNEIERAEIGAFIEKHGMPGFAPTQGHIPSGVPYLGFARDALMGGSLNRVMVVGKGSLFLGRMTNLFDGVSIVLERNSGGAAALPGAATEAVATTQQPGMARQPETAAARSGAPVSPPPSPKPTIGLTTHGSEHGPAVLFEGARLAALRDRSIRVVLIGAKAPEGFALPENVEVIETPEEGAHRKMEELLASGHIDGCVTAHYNFPIGVATVGKAVTPGLGREAFIATTTGAAAAGRVEAMVRNAIYGVAAAKACGIADPTVGVLNLDGAKAAAGALRKLKAGGYRLNFSESQRADGGDVLRGNDLLSGAADVMVADTLTGNILMKMLSSFTTGGNYESLGSGYGPGLGAGYGRLVLILSRASGAPVAAGAIMYAAALVRGDVMGVLESELTSARKAGLDGILSSLKKPEAQAKAPEAQARAPEAQSKAPEAQAKTSAREVVTAEITGIDVMIIEDAVAELSRAGIYAESGMGCTGPVVMVSEGNLGKAESVLSAKGFIELV